MSHRSDEFNRMAEVSARGLLSIIRKYTFSWPDRFGKDNYRVFMKLVVEAFEALGIRLNPDPKDSSHNERSEDHESHA